MINKRIMINNGILSFIACSKEVQVLYYRFHYLHLTMQQTGRERIILLMGIQNTKEVKAMSNNIYIFPMTMDLNTLVHKCGEYFSMQIFHLFAYYEPT